MEGVIADLRERKLWIGQPVLDGRDRRHSRRSRLERYRWTRGEKVVLFLGIFLVYVALILATVLFIL